MNKCDNCMNIGLSDEREVGAGYVPFCKAHHWSGASEDEETNEVYNSFRDDCNDFIQTQDMDYMEGELAEPIIDNTIRVDDTTIEADEDGVLINGKRMEGLEDVATVLAILTKALISILK